MLEACVSAVIATSRGDLCKRCGNEEAPSDPVCICDGTPEARALCKEPSQHLIPVPVDQCSFKLQDQDLQRVSICDDITFDADAHSQVLQYSSRDLPSLAERVNNARVLVASGDYLRAGAQIGPDDGFFDSSFENEQGILPNAVQIVIMGKNRETIEHVRVVDPMSTSRLINYQQLESLFPGLYYYM